MKYSKKKIALSVVLLISLILLITAVLAKCFGTTESADGVPVLNYHQINDIDKNSLTIGVEQFRCQMKYLSDNGYNTITPFQLADYLEGKSTLPEKPVLITFDDGYQDNYKNAYPILKEYGMTATIFLISDYVNTYPNYVTWDEVHEMLENRIVMQSHTLNHEDLTKIPQDQLYKYLTDSKLALEWYTKQPVEFIAYPCGEYSDSVIENVKKAGYRGGFTVNYGLASKQDNIYTLDRVPIFGNDVHTFQKFQQRLEYAPILSTLKHWKKSLKVNGFEWLSSLIIIP